MWSLKFPRELASPRRRLCNTKQEYLECIRQAIKYTDLFTTVYNYSTLTQGRYREKPDYSSAIIDRLYFDCDFEVKGVETDGYISMLKLHEWCEKNGNIKHQCYFTGSAYSVILAVTHNGLQNKSGAVYNAQKHIVNEMEILTDTQVMGDISRITRVPNTFNFKEKARRYAIPLKENWLYDGHEALREKAKKQRFGIKPIGENSFNIQQFDCQARRRMDVNIEELSFDDIDAEAREVIDSLGETPKCVQAMMAEKHLGYSDRRTLILWLRNRGLLLEETLEVLKGCLNARKYKHSVFEEKQPQYLYSRMMDMYFPRCSTISAEGYCDCKTENECGLR